MNSRRKALAQAKPLDALDLDEVDASSAVNIGWETNQTETIEDRPQKKRKLTLHDHEGILDFSQLPNTSDKANVGDPRTLCAFASLIESQQPSSSAENETRDHSVPRNSQSQGLQDQRQQSGRLKGTKRAPDGPTKATRTYNRGRTKWTEEEIQDLIKGVTIYGVGRWKDILDHPELYFQEGRTSTDLKDRFRVCFPPKPKRKGSIPPSGQAEIAISQTASPNVTEELPQNNGRSGQRARKRGWTSHEDAELVRGFERHGYNWKAMVKDHDLVFDERSSGQVRDRFRLKFKELYATQSTIPTPDTAAVSIAQSQGKEQPGKSLSLKEQSSDLANRTQSDGDDKSKLSDSALKGDSTSIENPKSAPLTWEDMATRPVFEFD